VRDLFKLGLGLMHEANTTQDRTVFGRALDYRDGLMISLLAATVLRMSNFMDLELGRTLVRRGATWLIAIPGPESKTGRPIEMSVPEVLATRLNAFLATYRPLFRGADAHRHIWPSRNARPLSESGVYSIITKRTREAFGQSINPHLFRDCAVTSIALHHGAEIHLASALLGHRHPRMTERYYNQAGMIEAVRGYQAILDGIGNRIAQGA